MQQATKVYCRAQETIVNILQYLSWKIISKIIHVSLNRLAVHLKRQVSYESERVEVLVAQSGPTLRSHGLYIN